MRAIAIARFVDKDPLAYWITDDRPWRERRRDATLRRSGKPKAQEADPGFAIRAAYLD
jgi:hypothetical protein